MASERKSIIQITQTQLFNTPYWCVTIEHFKKHPTKVSFNGDMISYVHDLKNKGKSRELSNEGGWQSELLPSQDFDVFFKEVYSILQHTNLEIKEMKVAQIWMNINRKGDWNQMHLHSGQYDLCGNYYIQAPSNCGKLVFKDPRPAAQGSMFLLNRYAKGEFHEIEPQEGMLLLFPPYLEHMVKPSKTNKERISISFDLNLN
jgi:uncharacterized protein (TIGR02466 family)